MPENYFLYLCPFQNFRIVHKERMKNTQEFWTKKYRRNIGRMIGLCRRYVPNPQEAEDLAHEAFLSAIEKSHTFKGLGDFDGWMMRITVNTALQHLRKAKCLVSIDSAGPELDSLQNEEAEDLERTDFSKEEITGAIAALPAPQRTVFNLFVFERYSHRQIADTLHIAVRTSKLHLAQARLQLQQHLKEIKNEKRLLMIPFLTIFKRGHAVDNVCWRTLRDFEVEPTVELDIAALSWGTLPSATIAMRLSGILKKLLVSLLLCAAAGTASYFMLSSRTPVAPSPAPTTAPIPVAVATDTTLSAGTEAAQSDPVMVTTTTQNTQREDLAPAGSAADSIREKEYIIIHDTVYKTVVKVVHDTVYAPTPQNHQQ